MPSPPSSPAQSELGSLETRLRTLEVRFEVANSITRIERVELKLDAFSERVTRLEERITHLPTSEQAGRLEERIARLPSTAVLLTMLGLFTTVMIALLANIPGIVALFGRLTPR